MTDDDADTVLQRIIENGCAIKNIDADSHEKERATMPDALDAAIQRITELEQRCDRQAVLLRDYRKRIQDLEEQQELLRECTRSRLTVARLEAERYGI